MINLYIFNESSRAAVYGIGTYIRELTTALKDDTMNICVVHLRSGKQDVGPEISEDGIRHWHIPASVNRNTSLEWNRQNELYYRNIVYLLKFQIKDTNRLVFHLNYMQSHALIKELRRVFSCKIIFTIHYFNWCFSLSGNMTQFSNIITRQDDISKDLSVKKEFLEEKDFFNQVDQIVCLSSFTREIMQRDYQIASHRLHVIYNGLSENNDAPVDKNLLREKYRFSEKISVILYVGRLDDIKGLKYVLRAFRIVVETFPDCRMLIVGDGSYDTCLKECEDIWTSIIFTGRLKKDKLYELYSIADIGVMPSFHEQCSYVAIEMMMHGVPLIASTSTGLKEMVVDEVTGFHIPVEEYPDKVDIDTELLAQKILYLLEHPEERKRMGDNARKRYETVYPEEIFRKKMTSLYHSLFV